MAQVDFYVLGSEAQSDTLRFLCRLIEKAYQQGKTLHVHTDSAQTSQQLDELLWTFSDNSFIPHQIDNPEAPINISQQATASADILINLAQDIPSFANSFARIIEVVTSSDTSKAISREHYRYYREQGMQLQSHNI